MDVRFVPVDVQPGGRQLPRRERRDQRVVVDHGAAARVDDDGPVRQQGDPGGVQQPEGFRAGHAVERQEVAMRHQFLNRRMVRRALLQFRRHPLHVVVVDLHVEPAGPPGDDPPDASEPDDAEPLPRDLRAHHESGAPVLPFAGADQPLALAGPPRGAQHQHHGQLGGGVGQHLGRVRDDDPLRLGGDDVHVVVADAKNWR